MPKFRHLLQGDSGREQDHVPSVAGAGFISVHCGYGIFEQGCLLFFNVIGVLMMYLFLTLLALNSMIVPSCVASEAGPSEGCASPGVSSMLATNPGEGEQRAVARCIAAIAQEIVSITKTEMATDRFSDSQVACLDSSMLLMESLVCKGLDLRTATKDEKNFIVEQIKRGGEISSIVESALMSNFNIQSVTLLVQRNLREQRGELSSPSLFDLHLKFWRIVVEPDSATCPTICQILLQGTLDEMLSMANHFPHGEPLTSAIYQLREVYKMP